jgi:hypothetical protein
MQFSGGRGDLPLIDTLLVLPLLGIAVSLTYLLICKIPKNLKITEAHSKVWTVDREVWTCGDPSFKDVSFEEVECPYCRTIYPHDLSKCPNCYAPRRMKI